MHEEAVKASPDVPEWRRSVDRSSARRRIAWAALTLLILAAVSYLTLWLYKEAAADATEAAATKSYAASSEVSNRESELRGSSDTGDRERLARELNDARIKSALATDERSRAEQRQDTAERLVDVWPAVLLGAALIFIAWRSFFIGEKRRDFQTRIELGRIEREAKKQGLKESQRTGDPLSLASLWAENRVRLEGYHGLVTSYAISTRQLTRTVLGATFAFLLVSATLAAIARNSSAAVATSIIAASGSALGAFVANAILRNAEISAKEVQAFFSHPLQLERVLNAERLISELPEVQQAEGRLRVASAIAGGKDLSGNDPRNGNE